MQAVKPLVERRVLQREGVVTPLPHPARDREAMHGTPAQGLEQQDVDRTGRENHGAFLSRREGKVGNGQENGKRKRISDSRLQISE
jgi:hypothetical protein